MMHSQPLYLADATLAEFEAEVVAHASVKDRLGVVVDRTAFYPESGGQLADRGWLGGVAVVDVQRDGAGAIVHLVAGELPPVGARLTGTIDRARRREHMALHTGQHILSRALLEVAAEHTVSSRLGETAATIDVEPGHLDEARRVRVEQLANGVVDEDLPVRCFFPEPDELAVLPLRKPARVAGAVRVVGVGDFDLVPCGGTHCARSAAVGVVAILSVERYKRGQRITFAAGARARTELLRAGRVARELARHLSSSVDELPAALGRLRGELVAAEGEVARLEQELGARLAAELAAQSRGARRIVAEVASGTRSLLRRIAKRLTTTGDLVALLACPAEEGRHVLFARGPASSFDCARAWRGVAEAYGGRGGGRPDHVEGWLPAGSDWAAVVAVVPPDT